MFLEKIKTPKDLKKLNLQQLELLAGEVRERIIQIVSCSGGHLASSLGTVELTIALHFCLDTPKDKIIWDVGHQAYTHKILTGRNKRFQTLRQYGGISGFPTKGESEYDSFTTGHSSTAVSLTLGLVCAKDNLPEQEHFRAVAVIGDGSLSGGLCFEGLNNAGHLNKDILVILNTNELSIAPNVGAISTYLNKIISMPIYNRFKGALENFAKSRIPKGTRLVKIASKFEEGLKGLFVPGVLFEELGFRYFGPFDGHNLNTLIPNLKNVLNIKGPRLVHVVTKKGKGYKPAEDEPVGFHSAAPFELESGVAISSKKPGQKTYTEVFSKSLVELARKNPKIIAVTAAMPEGTGLDKFRDNFPERFFDVGIAEGHAVCFAAGLAHEGLKPVVAIYSTFLQRAYDQIIECVALQNLGVVFALDRAGVVGGDGPTHQGVFDFAYLRHIPNLSIAAPADARELKQMLELGVSMPTSLVVRYPKDICPPDDLLPYQPVELGRAQLLKEGDDFLLVAIGASLLPSWEAMQILEKEGISGTLVNARFVKPLDAELLRKLIVKTKNIFTIEEGVTKGGFGAAVTEEIDVSVTRIGIPDEFICCGSRPQLLEKYGLDVKSIVQRIKSSLKREL